MTDCSFTRIKYVDPADAFRALGDDNKFHKITPRYEDMCISFNLIVRNYPRWRSKTPSYTLEDDTSLSEVEDGNVRVFTWYADKKETKGQTAQDITGGGKGYEWAGGGEEKYLTTYYTDICYDNYGTNDLSGQQKIVEGLGVESVNISFESWYTPTVTIKFIDVRGSAIWGNEEAIHTKETQMGNDDIKYRRQLSIENVFGCFMTLPMPRFHLQIKGFLGHPVTFQLACSSFSGSYNSQTGNFEAVVKFIGYSYSLLADIPISYLMYAPTCDYQGKTYWEEHVDSEAWKLTRGDKPPKLSDLLRNIKSLPASADGSGMDTSVATDQDTQEISELSEEVSKLQDLLTKHKTFTRLFLDNETKFHFKNVDATGAEQYVCYVDDTDDGSGAKTISAQTRDAYEQFTVSLKTYNEAYPNQKFGDGQTPNEWGETMPNQIHKTRLFVSSCSNGRITNVSFYGVPSGRIVDAQYLSTQIDFNKGDTTSRKMSVDNALQLVEKEILPSNYRRLRDYVYILDTHNFIGDISTRIAINEQKQSEIRKRVTESYNRLVVDQLGFEPLIGNVFKILMCHLETFIHILLAAENEIQQQYQSPEGRSVKTLGLNSLDVTDVVGIDNETCVPPWPLVFRRADDGNNENEIAWVGDYSSEFEEEKVVFGLCQAIEANQRVNNGATTVDRTKIIPLAASDSCRSANNLYSNLLGKDGDLSTLIGHVVMRMGRLLGVELWDMNADQARKIGRADAFNMVYTALETGSIQPSILDKVESYGGFQKAAIDIATCSPNAESFEINTHNTDGSGNEIKKYNFEIHKINDRKRDYIMREEGDNYVFDRYLCKNKDGGYVTPVLPDAILSDFKDYDNVFKLSNDKLGYNIIATKNEEKSITIPSIIHNAQSVNIYKYVVNKSDSAIIDADNKLPRLNNDLLTISHDQQLISDIQNIRDSLANDTEYSAQGCKFKPSLNDDTILDKLYGKKDGSNTEYETLRVLTDKSKIEELITNSKNKNTSAKFIPRNEDFSGLYAKYNDNEWKLNNETVSTENLYPYSFHINNNASLFGHPFYYIQNNAMKNITSNPMDDAEKERRMENIRCAKTLLLLHTFDFKPRSLNFSNKDGSVVDCCPYAYILFLGGLLWWAKCRDKGDISIVFDLSNNTSNFKQPQNGFTLIGKKNSANAPYFYVLNEGSTDSYNTYHMSEYFGSSYDSTKTTNSYWMPEDGICDILINEFKSVANQNICYPFELLPKSRCDDFGCVFVSNMRDAISDICDCLKNNSTRTESKYKEVMDKHFKDWNKNYSVIIPNADIVKNSTSSASSLFMVTKPGTDDINKILNILMEKVVVFRGRNKVVRKSNNNDSTPIQVSKSKVEAYLSGFGDGLKEISDGKSEADSSARAAANSDTRNDEKRAARISMYLYLKNVWDKWIVTSKDTEFDVNHFFDQHFFFIDSFYRNIYDKLPINCDKLYDIITSTAKEKSLYSVLDAIVSEHHCIFFAVPDFISFNGKGDGHDVDKLIDMFTPLPYNRKEPVETQNKFIIIYTTPPSKINPTDKNFKQDNFNLIDTDGNFNPPSVFAIGSTTSDPSVYGYSIPSFGVSMSTQYNHIFKSINVNMNNPTMTDSAIKIIENVVNQNHNNRQFAYVGQDLYSVYANYAYECEIEMLGCAQIAPLMYFQLLNVPMWRGTFMIFNVQHSLTAGNMITKFKGTKMSKSALPFVDKYYTWYANEEGSTSYSGSDYGGEYTYGGTTADNAVLQESYTCVETPKDNYHDPHYNGKIGDELDSSLITLFNHLVDEIKLLEENKGKGNGRGAWNVYCRSTYIGRSSGQHGKKHAMDLAIRKYNSDGSIEGTYGNSDDDEHGSKSYKNGAMPQLMTVLDMIQTKHRNLVGRIIIEYNHYEYLLNGGQTTHFAMLHVESPQGFSKQYMPVMMANFLGNDNYYHDIVTNCVSDKTINSPFLKNLPQSFRVIAAKEWKSNKAKFKQTFTNFATFGDGVLEEYFNGVSLNYSGVAGGDYNVPGGFPSDAQLIKYLQSCEGVVTVKWATSENGAPIVGGGQFGYDLPGGVHSQAIVNAAGLSLELALGMSVNQVKWKWCRKGLGAEKGNAYTAYKTNSSGGGYVSDIKVPDAYWNKLVAYYKKTILDGWNQEIAQREHDLAKRWALCHGMCWGYSKAYANKKTPYYASWRNFANTDDFINGANLQSFIKNAYHHGVKTARKIFQGG